MKRGKITLLLCFAFAFSLFLPVTDKAVSAKAAAEEKKVEPFSEGDVLKILVLGREDLTGQYTVQEGGVLSLPLIGVLSLAARTPRELEATLATEWENRLGSPMSVSVEFIQRAPFFILGTIRSPGMYPYRNGLTVLQALAIGGGMSGIFADDARLRMDVMHERERRMQAVERLAQATAARARLIAEREGRTDLPQAEDLPLVTPTRMGELIAEQQILLDTRVKQKALKESLFREQIDLGEAEQASYQQQADALQEQAQLVDKEMKRIAKVAGQQVRAFELQQRETSLETAAIAAQADISRVKSALASARNGLATIQESYRQEISEALVQVDATLSEARATERATADMLGSVGLGDADAYPEFRVTRRNSSSDEIVGPSTLVSPGDVIDVSIPAAKQSGSVDPASAGAGNSSSR